MGIKQALKPLISIARLYFLRDVCCPSLPSPMKPSKSLIHVSARLVAATAAGLILIFGLVAARAAIPPVIGDSAPNFTLTTLGDKPVELKQVVEKSPVVLVVLRGWPGYQCPICTMQVHDFVSHAGEFASRGVKVLMVYPGPAGQLKAHAAEFLADKSWPAEFLFVTDPDYEFTNSYGLRWNAAKETAYPSTFVLERGGRVHFVQISKTHRGRVGAEQALAALP